MAAAAPAGGAARSLAPLGETLAELGVPGASSVSSKWRCVVAPTAPVDASGALDAAALLALIASGTPAFLPRSYAERVHAAAGRDGLAAITKQQALGFGAPRLAMLGGWGAPGTPLVDDDHVTFVNSFGEALASPEGRVNLQAFHREAQAADAPPPLPALLDWPLPDVLFGDAAGANASRAPLATRVDMATRVSQAGAVTWWHLDDGGEVTLQVALPVDVAARANARPLAEPVVRDASQLDNPVVVKVFIFVPREAYTMVFDDVECNKSGRWASLDLFNTPDDALPDAERLPPIVVAPLAAGAAPLLSPPNAPHYVVTLQDCCMVEQRVVLHAHLDEAWHFVSDRAKAWAEPPIVYPVLRAVFGDDGHAVQGKSDSGAAARGHPDATFAAPAAIGAALAAQCADNAVAPVWRKRVAASLRCMLRHAGDVHFDRETRERFARAASAVVEALAEGPDMAATSLARQVQLEASCMGSRGVVRLGWACGAGGGEPGGWCAVVHEGGRPRFGPERPDLAAATADRKALMAARRRGRDALAEAMRGLCAR